MTSAAIAAIAWLITAVYYFYQYTLRSAPAVMMPQLSDAFGLSALGVASLVGLFYYGYSPFSLVAGVAMDRLGPRKVVPIGAAAVGVGALLFATGQQPAGERRAAAAGRRRRVRAVGAVYIATTNFPPSRAATLIGATQMFGMAGGSAGQFVVGPLIARRRRLERVLDRDGHRRPRHRRRALFAAAAAGEAPRRRGRDDWLKGAAARAGASVFRNPQSILCGMIAGLLFIPTTIFDMIWGVRYLQEAHGLDYATAVMRSATVPFGWIIGCPLLGCISDRIGRRKPVIVGERRWCCSRASPGSSTAPADVLPPYVLGLVAGIASGAAMLPYTVIKEANPPEMSGTATGVINFLNFTFSALLGPVFGWALMRGRRRRRSMTLDTTRRRSSRCCTASALAIVLTFFLKETGPAARGLPVAREVT